MPFSSEGVYTPPNGSENAVPGQIIASATWNAIHTDIAAAITALAGATLRTILTGTTVNVTVSDFVILMKQAAPAPTTINLPASATFQNGELLIKDIAGAAFANNLTITPNGVERIDGLATYVIGINYGMVRLRPIPSAVGNGWYVVGT